MYLNQIIGMLYLLWKNNTKYLCNCNFSFIFLVMRKYDIHFCHQISPWCKMIKNNLCSFFDMLHLFLGMNDVGNTICLESFYIFIHFPSILPCMEYMFHQAFEQTILHSSYLILQEMFSISMILNCHNAEFQHHQ